MCSVVLPIVRLGLSNFLIVLIVVAVHWQCQLLGSLPSIISLQVIRPVFAQILNSPFHLGSVHVSASSIVRLSF